MLLTEQMCKTFEELGWVDKWIENAKLETARAMFAEGDSLEKIARVTSLPLEMLKEKLNVK